MASGFPLSDFKTIEEYSWKVYRALRTAPSEFKKITDEVLALHTALKLLQDASEDSTSLVSRASDANKLELSRVLHSCRIILNKIDELRAWFQSLGINDKGESDVIKFRAKYLDGLDPLRAELVLAIANLNLLQHSIETSPLARIEALLDDLIGEIRAGRRAPTLLCSVIKDAEVGWPQLKIELAAEGIPKSDLEMYRASIEEWIRGADEDGPLDDMEARTVHTSTHVHQRQLPVRERSTTTYLETEAISSQTLSQTENPATTDEARAEDNFTFSNPVQLCPFLCKAISASPTESKEPIGSIPFIKERPGIGMLKAPAPQAAASKGTTAILEPADEVMSHTARPGSSTSPQLKKNPSVQEPREKGPYAASGYISVTAMSTSPTTSIVEPRQKKSPNSPYKAGRDNIPPKFLSGCLFRFLADCHCCEDEPLNDAQHVPSRPGVI